MKVLMVWPPHVPSYFNAGHHTPLYMTAGYLRRIEGVESLSVIEAGVLNMNWKAMGDALYQNAFDVIAVMNDIDAVDGLERFIYYARSLSPKCRIITFGRLSSLNGMLFRNFDLDAIVMSGDYECGVAEYVTHLRRGALDGGLPGTAVRIGGTWHEPCGHGEVLPPEDWVLPDVGEIPYRWYDNLYADDAHKFCGIPQRRELVVPVARGCPIGCSFCDVPSVFGLKERRISVARAINYIRESRARSPFEYVAFYAPTFTLDKGWVRELAHSLMNSGERLHWKCATTVHHLDRDLVALMGESGCVRISVGLETLEPSARGTLPRAKQIHEEKFRALAEWCRPSGVELNAFVIVGLPGTTTAGIARTRAVVAECGARFRPTVYTPFEELRADRPGDLNRFNRQILPSSATKENADAADLYRFVFGIDDRLTAVQEKILKNTTGTAV
jgi:radical SAM superfamily enzyme YgiQ (UPF0313 family)